jgi:hypothetical protein
MKLPQWTEVLTTALVGTERRSDVDSPEGVLDAAAALAVARRAGMRPDTGLEIPPGAGDESEPIVLPAAALRLTGLLAGDSHGADLRVQLLREWLELAAAGGWRAPPELLPDLLDTARGLRMLRPPVAATGGARALWLASLNPEWSYLLSETGATSDPKAWEEGRIGSRVGYLSDLRLRDPAAGLALLERTWAEESPDDRLRLLSSLHNGLGGADEGFLERALDDPRREIRAAAADLLAAVAGSGYQQRMAQRAWTAVRLENGTLRVEPPDACDTSMRRDGIASKPPSGVGERAWWLEEVVGRTPLDTWPEPAEFLARLDGTEWAGVMYKGLARAASTQDSPQWAAALLDVLAPQLSPRSGPDEILLIEALYEALPPEQRAVRAARALAQPTAPGLSRLLELCPAPWPLPLAEAFCANVFASRRVAEWCRLAATRLPLDETLLAGLFERLSPGDTVERRAVEHLVDVLRFRHQMTQEFQ